MQLKLFGLNIIIERQRNYKVYRDNFGCYFLEQPAKHIEKYFMKKVLKIISKNSVKNNIYNKRDALDLYINLIKQDYNKDYITISRQIASETVERWGY